MCSLHLRRVEDLHRHARDPAHVPFLAADFVCLDGLGEVVVLGFSGNGGQQRFCLGLIVALSGPNLLRFRRAADLDRICGDRESDHRVFLSVFVCL